MPALHVLLFITMSIRPLLTVMLAAAQDAKFPEAEELYLKLIKSNPGKNEKALQEHEKAFTDLAVHYREVGDAKKLKELVAIARPVTSGYAKSKTAKIIRTLIDEMAQIPNSSVIQIEAIKECIDWTVTENRSFLRQNLQVRLIALFYSQKAYAEAVQLIGTLLSELKRLDDKMMLVEVQLLEAKVYHALRNIPKSRASLTSARTSANAIYCPTLMQAQLDMMSGILQAEDGDYKTSFSYFYEAFEAYSSLNDPTAVTCLKYLLLVKLMLNLSGDVKKLLASKALQKYSCRDIDAMKAMAQAHSERSLQQFEQVLKEYHDELSTDTFIASHFNDLYDKLFQENLVKVILPYSCVEISHLAELIGLDARQIEGKLSQMILDKVFNGVLDQGNGWLYVYDEPTTDVTYDRALETIKHMSTVVELLYEKAAAIN